MFSFARYRGVSVCCKNDHASGRISFKVHTRNQCGKIRSNHSAGCLSARAVGSLLWGHMQMRQLVPVFLQRSLLLVFCVALNSCHSHKAHSGPSIEFTHIPPAAQGGRERVDTIYGLVRNARPEQQIIIYAHSGPWWAQPWPDHPFIPIKADSTWSTETHLGFEYAALLVEPDYHPQPMIEVAPTQGGSVALVTIVKGVGPPQFAPTGSITQIQRL